VLAHSRQLLYLHPTKTGGTSIEVGLLELELKQRPCPEIDSFRSHMYSVSGADSSHHWTYKELVEEFPFLSSWESFMTTRNPYERVISEWRYQQSGNRAENTHYHLYDDINGAIKNGAVRDSSFQYHWTPQYEYVGPNTSIIPMEKIDEEWEKMGFSPISSLNVSKDKKEYKLDDDSLEIIYKDFERDFECFNYSSEFDPNT